MASGPSTLAVVAILTPKPEHLSTFEAKVSALADQVEAKEPDALAYDVHSAKNEEQGVEFVFLEKYVSEVFLSITLIICYHKLQTSCRLGHDLLLEYRSIISCR